MQTKKLQNNQKFIILLISCLVLLVILIILSIFIGAEKSITFNDFVNAMFHYNEASFNETIIRNIESMVESYGKDKYKVVFGGSCNVDNTPRYANISGIDGFVLSTASLDAKQFARILCGIKKL